MVHAAEDLLEEALATKLVWRYTGDQFICPWCDPVPREDFPAPRETDCAYGCCKAGDIGLFSEVVKPRS